MFHIIYVSKIVIVNGGNNTVYIEKGLQNLNGEQALAFARNRQS